MATETRETRNPARPRRLFGGGGGAPPPGTEPARRRSGAWGWVAAAFVLGGLLGWGTTAAWWHDRGRAVADVGVTGGDIVAHPATFVGSTVTITGQISGVGVPVGVGAPAAGALAGGADRSGANGAAAAPVAGAAQAAVPWLRDAFRIATPNGTLIVLGGRNDPTVRLFQQHAQLALGDLVQVHGVVRRLDVSMLQARGVRWVDVRPARGGDATSARPAAGGVRGRAVRYDGLAGQPALVAARISLVPQLPRTNETLRALTVSDVATAPTAFYGRRVTLSGSVAKRLSQSAYVLGDGDGQVLVFGSPPAGGGRTTVSGTVAEPSSAALLALAKGRDLSSVLGRGGRSSLGDYRAALIASGG